MSRELTVLREFYVTVSKLGVENEVTGLSEALQKVENYYNPTKQQLDLELVHDMIEGVYEQEATQDLQAD